MIELLAPKQGEKVLNLGCGTGDLANTLFMNGVEVTGVDKSKNMVEQAIIKYPQIEFLVQDATELDYKSEFDAVFSNATLHWVQPANQALNCIYQCLKKGGRFVAEFGGKGNVQTITDKIIHQIFDRPTQLIGDNGLKNWINMFGNDLFKGIPEHTKSEIITNVENNLKEVLNENGTWIADYKRIRVIGIKNN